MEREDADNRESTATADNKDGRKKTEESNSKLTREVYNKYFAILEGNILSHRLMKKHKDENFTERVPGSQSF